MNSFTTTIELPKSPTEVFDHLKEVPKWWSADFEGNSSNLNDEFVINHPGRHYSKQKLIEVIPAKKITWLVTESSLPWLQQPEEWTNTKMHFELTPKTNGTILEYTHEGLTPDKECYDKCKQGWTMVITDWLFHYITEGTTR